MTEKPMSGEVGADYIHSEMTDPAYIKVCGGEMLTDDERAAWRIRHDARLDAVIMSAYTFGVGALELPTETPSSVMTKEDYWRNHGTPDEARAAAAISEKALEYNGIGLACDICLDYARVALAAARTAPSQGNAETPPAKEQGA